MHRVSLFAVILICIFNISQIYATQDHDEGHALFVRGVVFNDTNNNLVMDKSEKGLGGVCVSNGREVVKTNRDGRYELPIDDDTIIFLIKPSGWKTTVDENNLPGFYYIHKPNGSPDSKYPGVEKTGPLPASVDFPLYREKEPKHFRAVIFGDTQPRNQEEIGYIAYDVVEELIGVDAEFGVTLGDIVFDDLSLFDSLNRTIAQIGIPWHNVIGNHDTNKDSPGDKHSDETFETVYGPSYYSFNYGEVHFIIIDDIAWEGNGYNGKIGEEQLEFIENDLEFVPGDKLIVLMMHIPLVMVADRPALFDLLKDRPHTLSLSAHWHRQRHVFFGGMSGWHGEGRHHHLVQGTACGSWWGGAPDEYGIPHATMSDGTPNGYSFITFDGNEYSIEYKVARAPESYQMNIYAPEEVSSTDARQVDVLVNVFFGSERSTVEMKFGEDGEWVRMKRVETYDPYIREIKKAEEGENPPGGRKLPSAGKSGHIWQAPLPADPAPGRSLIYVRTTDMFGHVFESQRIIRII